MADHDEPDPTASGRPAARCVTVFAAVGAAVGLALAGASGAAPRAGCSAVGRRLVTCAPGGALDLKPYVTSGLIGLLLGILIAIAVILAWRDARGLLVTLRERETPWSGPAAASGGRAHHPALASRARP